MSRTVARWVRVAKSMVIGSLILDATGIAVFAVSVVLGLGGEPVRRVALAIALLAIPVAFIALFVVTVCFVVAFVRDIRNVIKAGR